MAPTIEQINEYRKSLGKPALTSTPSGQVSTQEQPQSLSQKYGITPPPKPEPSIGTKLMDRVSQFTKGMGQTVENYSAPGKSKETLLGAGNVVGAIGGAIGDVGDAAIKAIPGAETALTTIGKTVKGGLDMYDKNVLQPLGNKIGNALGKENVKKVEDTLNPGAQAVLDTANTPEVKQLAGNTLDVVRGLGTLEGTKVLTKGIGAVSEATGLTNQLGKVKTAVNDTVFGTPSEQFTKSFQKAFPTMAKDVKIGLPKKIEAGHSVVSDILKTDSAKLLDAEGNLINPANYSYSDLNEVFNKRMPEIYKEYSDSLSQVDKTKFESTIADAIKVKTDEMYEQLAKENLEANRRVLTQKIRELGTLRDTSPEGIQKYIEGLNQEAKGTPGAALTVEQIQSANLAGAMRKTLDESIDSVGDVGGYQDARNLYGSYRTLKDQLAVLAARELRSTPGLVDRITNMGITAEGLNALLTSNPKGLLLSLGVKAGSKAWKYFGSPERSLNQLFKIVESENQNLSPKSASSQPSTTANINAPINNMPDRLPK